MAKTQKELEQHLVAKLFPAPDAAALDALRKRIFHAGKLKHPVVLFESKVIEHWPEYCACLEFDLPYTTTEYTGTAEELVEHLLKNNSLQLGKAHRALIGAYLKKLYRTQSRANQSAGGSGRTFIPKYHAREAAAEKIPAEITEADYAEREDFRAVTTFTIDPKDAKDFDDALSIRLIKPGLWEVGVHIADVTHYVKEGSTIDKEAEKRATSVYLVDRTIPMLPERLCNFICSLRPNEEKLAFSVIFDMNEKGEVKNSRIKHTVIKSDRRFTYEEAQQVIETGEGDYKEEILELNKLAQILRKQRLAAGAIDFDRIEVKFEIDETGKPLSVYFKESKEANKLIEEFMLLANRTVAETIGKVPKNKKAKVFPYRIHDLPDPDKLENLNWFINRFGYKIRTSGSKSEVSKSINRLLDDIKDKKEQNLIETVSLRAMQKARYSTVNIGHYGLAFDFYTHFTSPIRRFPDMMVHRLLTRYLAGGRTAQKDKYEDLCDHSSEMEQIASNAERASVKYKQVEFMSERVGLEFEGVISGVTEWGLYVEINENKCEGMVPMRDLGDDYYDFDEKNYCLIGRRHHKKFSLGDPVTIKVARANLEKKQLDFALVEK